MKNLFLAVFTLFLFAGCAAQTTSLSPFDRLVLSQKPTDYVTSEFARTFDDSNLRKKIFAVWDENFSVKDGEQIAGAGLLDKDGYGENLLLYTKEQKDELLRYTSAFSVVNKNGIVVKNSDIRALPTAKPYFFDPKKAGEGYPFDYFQESRVYANTPVRVLFSTQDKAFFYIANYVSNGWIDSRNVAFISPAQRYALEKSQLFVSIKDKTAIFDESGIFLEKMPIGSFIFKNGEEFLGASRESISRLMLDESAFSKLPLEFSQTALAALASRIMHEPYGWGGLLDDRDCSMFLRDLFLPFGVYLPRNSKDQAAPQKDGYIDLSKFGEDEKLKYIKHNAVPFRTLLYMRGHVLLYIGSKDDEPLVLHDVWGFTYSRNFEEKRFVVGRPVVSTLYLGERYDGYDKKRSLAARLLGMRSITP